MEIENKFCAGLGLFNILFAICGLITTMDLSLLFLWYIFHLGIGIYILFGGIK